MKTFSELPVLAVIGLVAWVSAPPAVANPSIVSVLPDIGPITAKVGEWVAIEVKEQLARMLSAPRVVRSARPQAVTIFEGNLMVVEATRLPHDDSPTTTLANERALPLQF